MLDDGGTLRIVKSGEEDAGYGIYRAADIEVNGVRRRGDVLFGGNSVEGREHGNGLLPAALQWAVLHVVSAPAAPLYDAGGERIPQLVVSVPQRLRDAVASLRTGASRYECGIWLGDLPAAKRISFLDRLVVERLDRKCRDVLNVLERCGGDWAQALYTMLFRAMGGNRNREPYIDLASRATYQMVLRERGDIELVEALLLGTAGMLEGCYYFDDYIARLHDHYLYLARKYGIVPMRAGEWARAGIRAQNRPVTRIVQLASFVARNDFIFDRVAGCRTREDVHALFDTEVSGYWAVPAAHRGGEGRPARNQCRRAGHVRLRTDYRERSAERCRFRPVGRYSGGEQCHRAQLERNGGAGAQRPRFAGVAAVEERILHPGPVHRLQGGEKYNKSPGQGVQFPIKSVYLPAQQET